MSDTRRTFLNSIGAIAAGLSGTAALSAQTPPQKGDQKPAAPLKPAAQVQVPRMKFGNAEISRLVCGCNQFYGYAHFNQILGTVMQEYYTPERVCEVLHQCNRFGINAYNYFPAPRAASDWARFQAEGGKMHLIVQGTGDSAQLVKTLKPLAIYHHGERTDRAYQEGDLDSVKEWCKQMRDLGVTVGVGTHQPEVIAEVESQNWDVDFYAGCVYKRTRTDEEWRKVLGGQLPEMPREIYLQSDPPQMYKVMRATRKPCFAFKILGAGRVTNVEQAFRTAFESIKRTDGVFVGLFPRVKDEVRENAERVHRILSVGA
jgi:hypothetical protein